MQNRDTEKHLQELCSLVSFFNEKDNFMVINIGACVRQEPGSASLVHPGCICLCKEPPACFAGCNYK